MRQLTLAGVDYRSDLFIRQLETPNAKYAKEIVKMNPVLYYPMDVQEDGIDSGRLFTLQKIMASHEVLKAELFL